MHGGGGMGARVPKERRAEPVSVTVVRQGVAGRKSLSGKPFSPWHMRCQIAASPAVPTRAMRACEGRLTRRRSWQQSARKDRPAGARAGHPGAAVRAAAVPAVAARRAVRAARAVPDRDARANRGADAARAALAAHGGPAARPEARAPRAAVPRGAADLGTIRGRAWGHRTRADAARQAPAAPIVDRALSR